MSITHLFPSLVADGADATLVQPGDWNDDHVITALSPAADDTHDLGTSALRWQDLWLSATLNLDADAATLKFGASQDIILARDAANVLAQRNGTNAQALRVYNTFTDASNYERLALKYATNVATIEHEFAGTGSDRFLKVKANTVQLEAPSGDNVQVLFGGLTKYYLGENRFYPNASLDLGLSGLAWRDFFLSRDLRHQGANGQELRVKYLTELTTIAAAATTDTTIQAPAGSLVLGVSVRVTVVIPTAATFDVGVSGATTRYGTGIAVAADTTNTSPGTTNPSIYAAATSIRITPNAQPADNSGRVRVTIHYIDLVAATS